MFEELVAVVRIINNLENKIIRMTESQNRLGEKVEASIGATQDVINNVDRKKRKKLKSKI